MGIICEAAALVASFALALRLAQISAWLEIAMIVVALFFLFRIISWGWTREMDDPWVGLAATFACILCYIYIGTLPA